jgi:tetratricopeptide (TPR) repeat protein
MGALILIFAGCGGNAPTDGAGDFENNSEQVARAKAAYESGDYATAGKMFDQLAKGTPSNEQAQFLKAQSNTMAGQWGSAFSGWSAFFEISSDFDKKLEAIQLLAQSQGTNEAFPIKKLTALVEQEAARQSLDTGRIFDVFSGLVLGYERAGKWSDAFQSYEKLRKVMTPDQEFGVNLGQGMALYHLKKYDRARKMLRENLPLVKVGDRSKADIHLHLAQVDIASKDFDDAFSQLQKAQQNVYDPPFFVETAVRLAAALAKNNQPQKALGFLDQILRSEDPKLRGKLLIEKGNTYLKMENKPKAIAAFESAKSAITDKNTIGWLEDTIKELKEVAPEPPTPFHAKGADHVDPEEPSIFDEKP